MKTKKLIREVVKKYGDGRLTAHDAMIAIAKLVGKDIYQIDQTNGTAVNWGVKIVKRIASGTGSPPQ